MSAAATTAAGAAGAAQGVGYIGSGSFGTSDSDATPSATPKAGVPKGYVPQDVADKLTRTIEALERRIEAYESNAEPSLTRTFSTSRSITAPSGAADYKTDDTDTLTLERAEMLTLQAAHSKLEVEHAACAGLQESFERDRSVLEAIIAERDKSKAASDAVHDALVKAHAGCAGMQESFDSERLVMQATIAGKDELKKQSDEAYETSLQLVTAEKNDLKGQIKKIQRIAYCLAAILGTAVVTGVYYFAGDCLKRYRN